MVCDGIHVYEQRYMTLTAQSSEELSVKSKSISELATLAYCAQLLRALVVATSGLKLSAMESLS